MSNSKSFSRALQKLFQTASTDSCVFKRIGGGQHRSFQVTSWRFRHSFGNMPSAKLGRLDSRQAFLTATALHVKHPVRTLLTKTRANLIVQVARLRSPHPTNSTHASAAKSQRSCQHWCDCLGGHNGVRRRERQRGAGKSPARSLDRHGSARSQTWESARPSAGPTQCSSHNRRPNH